MSTFQRTRLESQPRQQRWWGLLIRGIVAVLFGLGTLFWPHLTLLVLVALFGVYVLIDGITAVIGALREYDTNPHWWVLFLEGLAGIVIGVLTFVLPGLTALALLYLIAIWAIVTGVMELVSAFAIRRVLPMEWTLIIAGILSIVLGIFLALRPVVGLLGLVWAIGIYAIIFGILLIVRAFQFRMREPSAPAAPAAPV
ncbi:MAG TPA: HdeD family acid-resistance protein [Ktedonobacteraceae bacterium]|jgi:uncharacterized membrane protein HdeD (DUF308 family)|nr:HdeD family acid-resistance protein [Ktedonobacteraceae bacterium]